MKYISNCFFSFIFLAIPFCSQAYENPATLGMEKNEQNDTIKPKLNRYGLRIGADLIKLTQGFYDKNYKGIEIAGDFRLSKKKYLALEIGSENKTTEDTQLTSNSNGYYLKAGVDYNMYDNWLDMENIISIGYRCGFSTFSQELNSYKIYNSNSYWKESASIPSNQKFNGLNAGWLEVVAGMKTKIFNNVFLGFGLQLKMLVINNKANNFDNLYIPGFNRTYDGSFGFGFNYGVSYFIPLYKKVAISNSKPK